ncbi:MAG: hypothetical protein NZ551_02335 [Microscillaceae bacterium]|nr:hypothetical protein [Microscillaceae bacterium]MDW8460023.1 bestrophin family ion channel [Cytophagales bacterium]
MPAKRKKLQATRTMFFHQSMWDITTLVSLLDGMIILGFYTYFLVYLNYEVFELKLKMTGVVHSILGLALGLLLVFRTNTAYERWWEGRRMWGSLINNSRNFAIKVNAFFTQPQDREFFKRHIPAFAFALKHHLRDNSDVNNLHSLTSQDKQALANAQNLPSMIVKRMYELVALRNNDNSLHESHLLSLDAHLKEFVDVMGACDRIRSTPMPQAYNTHLNQFLNLYTISLPFSLIHDLKYWTILVVVFTFYALAGLKLIGEEIEDPFGKDINDLPLDAICQSIERSVNEILA